MHQTGDDKYLVQVLNMDMALPLDVKTDSGILKITTSKKGTVVTSKTLPEIDPSFFYLKKVIIE